MERKVIYTVIIVAILIIAGVAVYYAFTPPAKQEKVLIVGTSSGFPPFEYVDPNTHKVVGFDIDLITIIAHKIGYDKVEIKDMEFDSLIPALQAGTIDVAIAGMTITPAREKVVDFSKPYWHADQAVVVRKDSNLVVNSPEDLHGLKIGVQTGTTGESYVTEKVGKDNATIKSYPSYVEAVQALVNGQIDVIVVDTPVAQNFVHKYDVKIIHTFETGETYGIAVKKGNTKLLNEINSALDEIMNSSEWNQLVNKYFGSSS